MLFVISYILLIIVIIYFNILLQNLYDLNRTEKLIKYNENYVNCNDIKNLTIYDSNNDIKEILCNKYSRYDNENDNKNTNEKSLEFDDDKYQYEYLIYPEMIGEVVVI